MGMVGLAIIFAPAIGPAIAGYILEHYSWRTLVLWHDSICCYCYCCRLYLSEKCR